MTSPLKKSGNPILMPKDIVNIITKAEEYPIEIHNVTSQIRGGLLGTALTKCSCFLGKDFQKYEKDFDAEGKTDARGDDELMFFQGA